MLSPPCGPAPGTRAPPAAPRRDRRRQPLARSAVGPRDGDRRRCGSGAETASGARARASAIAWATPKPVASRPAEAPRRRASSGASSSTSPGGVRRARRRRGRPAPASREASRARVLGSRTAPSSTPSGGSRARRSSSSTARPDAVVARAPLSERDRCAPAGHARLDPQRQEVRRARDARVVVADACSQRGGQRGRRTGPQTLRREAREVLLDGLLVLRGRRDDLGVEDRARRRRARSGGRGTRAAPRCAA